MFDQVTDVYEEYSDFQCLKSMFMIGGDFPKNAFETGEFWYIVGLTAILQ